MMSLGWRSALWLATIGLLAYGIHLALGLREPIYLDVLVGTVRTTTGVALLSFVLLVGLLIVSIGMMLRGVLGLGQIWTFFRRMRHKRGLSALSESLIALAEEDGKRALKAAGKAEGLLDDPDLTRLVTAQAAKLAGDEAKAARYYEKMIEDRDTSFLGAVGLMRQALIEDKTERALVLAERAHALRPKNAEVIDSLLSLQRKKGDWAGARETIRASVRAGRLTRDVGDRRRAVLHVTEALAKEAAGEPDAAREQALAAVRLAPSQPAAATLAARLLAEKGERRGAARLLIAAWRIEPHPEIAAGYAALEPAETTAARLARFQKLYDANPQAEETRLLRAELALAAEDFEQAREALGDLPYSAPTARACALMAAVEQSTGAAQETVRAWLASAAASPRSARWVCDSCGAAAEKWSYSCGCCDAFDSLDWRRTEGPEGLSEAALFPLLSGGKPKASGVDRGALSETLAKIGEPSSKPEPGAVQSVAAARGVGAPPNSDKPLDVAASRD